jgi:hypothetical protein
MAILFMGYRRRGNLLIESVQWGTVVATVAGADATISSVDTTRSVVAIVGAIANTTNMLGRVELLNATTVRGTAANATQTMRFMVIQFQSGAVKSIQNVTAGAGGLATWTATISSVNTAKTIILFRGLYHDTNDVRAETMTDAFLTNATTVTFHLATAPSGGAAHTAYVTVVEGN